MKKLIKPTCLILSGVVITRYVDWGCISNDVVAMCNWLF
jgi:hypothetical protein